MRDDPEIALPRRATSIWDRPDDWPYEPPGWVFIASAIKKLGKGDDEAGKKKLRELCAQGRLSAAVVLEHGRLEVLAAHQWNTDACKKWFASCEVSLRELMSVNPTAKITTHWLFIEKASLSAVVAQEEKQAPEPWSPDNAGAPDVDGASIEPTVVSPDALRSYLKDRKTDIIERGDLPPTMIQLWGDAKKHFAGKKVPREQFELTLEGNSTTGVGGKRSPRPLESAQ